MDVVMHILKRENVTLLIQIDLWTLSLSLLLAIVAWAHICQMKFSTNSAPAIILAELQETGSLALHFKAGLPWQQNFSLFFLFKTGYL